MDARTSRYHEIYARWQRDPQGFWTEAAREIDWIEPAKQVFDPNAGVVFAAGMRGQGQSLWNVDLMQTNNAANLRPIVPAGQQGGGGATTVDEISGLAFRNWSGIPG